jgi:ABC-type branched-subunit amino acid transport system substrate-binding protein
MSVARLLAWLMVCLNLAACSPDYDQMALQRLEYARQNKGDIHIVAVQDTYKSNYLNGVLLAAEEVNKRPDKLLGRTLNVSIEQDGESFDDTKPTIRRIAADPKVTAVLGHRSSGIAVPASVVYERSQILFIPPFSTAQELTGHNFQYVFRMTPNAEVMAEQIASVAQYLGYKNMVILYSREDLSRELAFLFEDAAVKRGIKLVQNSSFFEKEDNYRPLISQFTGKNFDAVFIASPPQAGGNMVRQLREMGINKPILGSDGFNLPAYAKTAGEAGQNTIVPAVYRPNSQNPRDTNFIQRYKDKYQEEPDYNAAQGYDSVMLLAAAIEKAGSTVPALLASTMHYLPAWLGVSGLYAYDERGDLYGKHFVFNALKQGKFSPLPAIHVPFLLDRFEKHLTATAPGDNTLSKADPPTAPQTGGQPAVAQPDQPSKPTSFAEIFSTPMYSDDHKVRLLELAQTIFQFKRLGLIYEDTENGRLAAAYPIVKQMTEQSGVKLVGCDIPFSALSKNEIELELISCYGKLSLNADAVFINNYAGINPTLIGRLNNGMTFFKVPAIYIGEKPDLTGLDIVLNRRTDVDPQGRGNMEVYRGLLHNIKVHELASHLLGMPEIAINLGSLQYQGFSDRPLLDLAPDAFMDSVDDPIPTPSPKADTGATP